MADVHSAAVEAAIESSRRSLTPADEPLLELARTLARQMDESGPDGPGTRLAGTYLTCVRTLSARLGTIHEPKPGGKLVKLRSQAQQSGRGA